MSDAPAETVRLKQPIARFRFRPGIELPEHPTSEQLVAAVPGWDKIERAYGQLKVEALFAPWSDLEALIERTKDLDPSYNRKEKFARFKRYFGLQLPADTDQADARELLSTNLRDLEYLSIQSHVPPPPTLSGVHYDKQTYLHTTGTHSHPTSAVASFLREGIHLDAVRDLPGGKGELQVLCDVELGWNVQHVDLRGAALPAAIPFHGVSQGSEAHGLQVLSVIAAQGDGTDDHRTGGCVGIAPGVAAIHLASEWTTASLPERHKAIMAALTVLAPGHVLLLEMHVRAEERGLFDPASGIHKRTMLPVEILDDVFDAIQLAVALRIVVVEAAGNGNDGVYDTSYVQVTVGVDLDLLQVGAAFPLRGSPFPSHDSGAILVGHSAWGQYMGSGPPVHIKPSTACVGSRIDAFAWGEWGTVFTANLDPGTLAANHESSSRNESFGGTSSASAIVAGVALVLQGLRAAQGYTYLTPLQLRALLRDPALGTPTTLPNVRLGRMPHLGRLAAQLGLLPDVYVRDFVGDAGGPNAAPMGMSPDIIVKGGASPPLSNDFKEGSGTEGLMDLSDAVQVGDHVWILVRARNRGTVNAVGATATVYFAPWLVGSPYPRFLVVWTKIGQAILPVVPSTGKLVVSPPIPWTTPLAAGTYVLAAMVRHPKDPVLSLTALPPLPFFQYWDVFRVENGLAPLFLTVAEPPAVTLSELEWWLLITWMFDERALQLEIHPRLPPGSRAQLEIPRSVRCNSPVPRLDRDDETSILELGLGVTTLRELHTTEPQQEPIPIRFRVQVPKDLANQPMELVVIQRDGGVEIGRFNWKLLAGRTDASKHEKPDEPRPNA